MEEPRSSSLVKYRTPLYSGIASTPPLVTFPVFCPRSHVDQSVDERNRLPNPQTSDLQTVNAAINNSSVTDSDDISDDYEGFLPINQMTTTVVRITSWIANSYLRTLKAKIGRVTPQIDSLFNFLVLIVGGFFVTQWTAFQGSFFLKTRVDAAFYCKYGWIPSLLHSAPSITGILAIGGVLFRYCCLRCTRATSEAAYFSNKENYLRSQLKVTEDDIYAEETGGGLSVTGNWQRIVVTVVTVLLCTAVYVAVVITLYHLPCDKCWPMCEPTKK